jgi:S1-C subfamily serine protease
MGERIFSQLILGAARERGDVNLNVGDVLVYNTPPRPYISGHALLSVGGEFAFQFVPPLDITEQLGFQERIITSYDQEITGFSLISIADLSFNEIPALTFAVNRHIYIGQAVALIGFQYDNPSLTIKSGIISAHIHRNGNRYLQFDGSTIWGNSGGPLIDLKTNEVMGIIGYKLDRKNKSYEKMMEISNSNIKMLEKAQGEFEVSGVDPIQVLIAWQKQILQLAAEVYKASGSGIGVAIDIKTVNRLLKDSGVDF